MDKLKEIKMIAKTDLNWQELETKLKKLCDETTATKTDVILTLIDVITTNQVYINELQVDEKAIKQKWINISDKNSKLINENIQLAELLTMEQLKNSALIKQLEKINKEQNND